MNLWCNMLCTYMRNDPCFYFIFRILAQPSLCSTLLAIARSVAIMIRQSQTQALLLDYIPMLRIVSAMETARQDAGVRRRFTHYFNSLPLKTHHRRVLTDYPGGKPFPGMFAIRIPKPFLFLT